MNSSSIAEVVTLPLQIGQISIKTITSCFDLLAKILANEQLTSSQNEFAQDQNSSFSGSLRMKTVSSLLMTEMRLKEIYRE